MEDIGTKAGRAPVQRVVTLNGVPGEMGVSAKCSEEPRSSVTEVTVAAPFDSMSETAAQLRTLLVDKQRNRV